jgi:hypothetical protein
VDTRFLVPSHLFRSRRNSPARRLEAREARRASCGPKLGSIPVGRGKLAGVQSTCITTLSCAI